MSGVALLVACFNRRETTLSFLFDVFSASEVWFPEGLTVYLLDDGSEDGTAAAVAERFPQVKLHSGGDLFWAASMVRLITEALRGDYETIVLANDDCRLQRDPVTRMMEIYREENEWRETVLVGAFADGDHLKTSYSGMRRNASPSPLSITKLDPDGTLQTCDTFNTNFVAAPAQTLRKVGGFDIGFRQAAADIDLGYRLKAAGVRLLVTPWFVGTCDLGSPLPSRLAGKSFLARVRQSFGYPRPLADSARLLWKHAGLMAPILIAQDIVRRLGRSALGTHAPKFL